ncbi:hypothetical protein MMCCUG48898_0071 [Mycobacteroides abscessus subsp. massiliense CCUG 48898 = JCM 15300]|nr:hypothetical protein MMCCUG48898_0071 [Mycobacteroides abscessus subsp. massiliense CCUG 48898 = JCM 15300]BAP95057.1 hypothetical protein MMASJCM_0281 [Mycobacteroides abscessus subsp. massiliense CCUG 48898 = JCM 15300]
MESPVEYLREQTIDAVRLYQSGGEHLAPDLEVDPDNRAVLIVHTLLKWLDRTLNVAVGS